MDLASLAGAVRLIGVPNALRAVRYALRRQRLDRRYFRRAASTASRTPGRFLEAKPITGGAWLRFEHAVVAVRMLAHGGVFVAWDGTAPEPSYALVRHPGWHHDAWLERDGDGWRIRSGELTVRAGRDGSMSFLDASGRVVRRDDPPVWHGTDPAGWRHRSTLPDDAAVLGLGGRSTRLDLRPGRYRLWNTDVGGSYGPDTDPLYLTMPVYLVVSDAGCHLAWYDNSYRGEVRLADTAEVCLDGGPLRYYVMAGTPDIVLDTYTAMTGRPTLPPRWGLGYHHSRWGFGSAAEVRRVHDGFRRHDLPLSAMHLDIDRFLRHNVFTVDPTRYPDLPDLAVDLAKQGVQLVTVVDPAIKAEPGLSTFDSGVAAGVFCRDARRRVLRAVTWPGTTVYPDFTDPACRAWWGQFYRGEVERGFAGFWHDMNEPSAFAAVGDPSLPLSTVHDLDGRGGDHREAHNVYGLLMNRAGYEALAQQRRHHRPFVISRSGWAGSQRYSGAWNGDVETSWAGMRASLTVTLHMAACGVPYSGPDIGGFGGHPDPELFVRWFQMASYLPFFRTHSAHRLPPREPWEFGEETLTHLRAALVERYRLLPYWYTLAWQAHRTGRPYVVPPLWTDTTDRALRGAGDTFVVGNELLVAPVFTPGATERTVRLPRGRWYDKAIGRWYDGSREVTLAAPIDTTPVLVRAGSVVPTAEAGTERIVLEVYQPPDGSAGDGRLVTDAGDGYDPPRDEHFTIVRDGTTGWRLVHVGTDPTVPYEVRWFG